MKLDEQRILAAAEKYRVAWEWKARCDREVNAALVRLEEFQALADAALSAFGKARAELLQAARGE